MRYGSVSAQILCIDLMRYCMQLEVEEIMGKVTVRILVYGNNDSRINSGREEVILYYMQCHTEGSRYMR
jgi:hypothetical protein